MKLTTSSLSFVAASLGRLRSSERSVLFQIGFMLVGSWLLAASSWIQIPMYPVPITMQTYALLVLSTLCGWRLAVGTTMAYLIEGACGLPVFAGGAGGAHHLLGPTGGYLFGFVFAAATMSFLAERGGTASFLRTAFTLTLGHAVVLACGVSWLALFLGVHQAIALGLLPFVAGTIVKTLCAAGTVRVLRRAWVK